MTKTKVVFFHRVMVKTGGVETLLLRILRGAHEILDDVTFSVVCAKSSIDMPEIRAIGSDYFVPGLRRPYDLPIDFAVSTGLSGFVASHGCRSVRSGTVPSLFMLSTTTELNWRSMDLSGRGRVARHVGEALPVSNIVFPTENSRRVSAIRFPRLVDSPIVPIPVWSAFGATSPIQDAAGSVTGPGSGSATRGLFRVCSVGRFEPFKTYNLWMGEVIRCLRSEGISITWDVFGSGTDEAAVRAIADRSGGSVAFRGVLPYEQFAAVVGEYDCFVGVGTAVWEAALTGIPCFVAQMWSSQPKFIGFVHECLEMSPGEPRADGVSFDPATALHGLVNMSPTARRDVGRADRDFVVSRMSPETVLPALLRVIEAGEIGGVMSPSLLRRDALFLSKELALGQVGVRTKYHQRGDELPPDHVLLPDILVEDGDVILSGDGGRRGRR